MSSNDGRWDNIKCLVCRKYKRILAVLFVEGLPICDDCGEWLSNGCKGYPRPLETTKG